MNAVEKIGLPIQSAIHTVKGGEVPVTYFGKVTTDYFLPDDFGGLRDAHFMEDHVPADSWETVKGYVGDPRQAVAGNPLDWARVRLAELRPAQQGALGNFLGDMARGADATHEQREQTAIASMLIVAMGNAAADARLELVSRADAESPSGALLDMTDFQMELLQEFYGHQHLNRPDASIENIAAKEIARHLHARLATNPEYTTHDYYVKNFVALNKAVMQQWMANVADVQGLFKTSQEAGRAQNGLVFAQVQAADSQQYPEVEQAAGHLGEMMAAIQQGVRPLRDLRVGEPTYGRAYLLREGVSRTTLEDLTQMREGSAKIAFTNAFQSLEGDKRALGIYRFAGFLINTVAKIEAANDRGPSGRRYRSALSEEVEKTLEAQAAERGIL